MYLRFLFSVLILSFLAGCGTATVGNGSTANLDLVVNDQEAMLYTRLKIQKIDIDTPVFLVIRDSFIDGSLNRILYSKRYEAGINEDLEIILDQAMDIDDARAYSDTFHALLYLDVDNNQIFDASIDEIAVDRSGLSISQTFKVSDNSRAIHAIVNIANDQGVAFKWTEQVDDLDGFVLDDDNTDGIILNEGWHYKIVNSDPNETQIRFLDANGKVIAEQAVGASELYIPGDADFSEVTHYDGGKDSAITGTVSFK